MILEDAIYYLQAMIDMHDVTNKYSEKPDMQADIMVQALRVVVEKAKENVTKNTVNNILTDTGGKINGK